MLQWWSRSSLKEAIPKHYAEVFKERSLREAFVLDPVKMAVSPDGKYVFIIGSRKIVVTSERNPMEWTTSFKVDMFDLNLEGRQTLLLSDLFDFGDYLVHVYALDSNTLILLDYNHRQTTLRQRIVKIATNIAISPFHRCYHYGTSQTSFIKAAIGDRLCAVVSRQRFEGQFVALIIPKDPIQSDEFSTPINISAYVNNNEMFQGLTIARCQTVHCSFHAALKDNCCTMYFVCQGISTHPNIYSFPFLVISCNFSQSNDEKLREKETNGRFLH